MTSGSGGRERRTYERFSCDLVVVCHPYFNPQDTLWEGRAVNVSCGGVLLEAACPLELAVVLNLRLKSRTSDAACARMCRVVYAEEQPGGKWYAGCRFTKELSDAELRSLLAVQTS